MPNFVKWVGTITRFVFSSKKDGHLPERQDSGLNRKAKKDRTFQNAEKSTAIVYSMACNAEYEDFKVSVELKIGKLNKFKFDIE